MRITLDAQEVAAIITNWGKEKYHTHNVSVENVSSSGSVEVMVTLPVDDFGRGSSAVSEAAISRLKGQMDSAAELPDLQLNLFDAHSAI